MPADWHDEPGWGRTEWSPDDEDEAQGDWDDDSSEDAYECADCGASVHEDSDHCPVCGHWREAAPARPLQGKPTWYLVLGLLGVVAVIVVLAGLVG